MSRLGSIARNLKLLRESAVFDSSRPRTDPLLPRGIERVVLRVLGRPVRCTACGRTLFTAFPVVWRGRLWIIGAYDHLAHVQFDSSETMEFRHGRLDECPAPERPWVQ
jgi:hypothetical protein